MRVFAFLTALSSSAALFLAVSSDARMPGAIPAPRPDQPRVGSIGLPYIGEIRWIAGDTVPDGWELCEGQLIEISQNTALFSLLGTIYGGDGRTNFALPDLRDRFPLGQGNGFGLTPRAIGERGGASEVALTVGELPPHRHTLHGVDDPADLSDPEDNVMARTENNKVYSPSPLDVDMHASVLERTGGNQPHANRQPYQGVRAMIAVTGVFPSQNVAGFEAVLGEVRWFAFNFAPPGFATCQGQLLPVAQNEALFFLIGTIYGGDGQVTFGLPDLRGRISLHQGMGPGLTNRLLGSAGGVESVALSTAQIPAHRHRHFASEQTPTGFDPSDHLSATGKFYKAAPALVELAPDAVASTGGGAAHENMAPYLALNPCIAFLGTFPSDGSPSFNGYASEVRWAAWNLVPQGYTRCDGQLLPVGPNPTLFSLMGTTYGGDGVATFGLPDLRGRAPIHPGTGVTPGQSGGTERVALAEAEMPRHSHRVRASSLPALTGLPSGAAYADAVNVAVYREGVPSTGGMMIDPKIVPLDSSTVGSSGGGQSHENMQPFLTLNALIALSGA